MREFHLGYMAEQMGMRSAIEQFGREQVKELDSAFAKGQFAKPVLGPLANAVKSEARWTDEYPAWPHFADELERLLEFAKSKGQWDQYLGRLRGSNNQRDSALMELRVGLHLESCGFNILSWEPKGAGENAGEYLVEGSDKCGVFTEVKSPGWEGEVSEAERDAGRLKQSKHIHLEGRAVAPWERIQFAVGKAYKKLLPTMPNLLVIADDLFVSLEHGTEMHMGQALYSSSRLNKGYFTDRRYENLGGVAIFWLLGNQSPVQYEMRLFLNANALKATTLPADMRRELRAEIIDPSAPPRQVNQAHSRST